jgi:predicted Rossmann-fold nucleotide-binding protein
MRKYWFAYLAKALVVFPGGWGTMDEMFELLTLAQTHKLAKPMTIVVYGRNYWESVVNMQTFVDKGAISPDDLDLFQWADTPEEALEILKAGLEAEIHGSGKLDDFKFDEASGEAQRPADVPAPERPEDYFGPEIAETRS